jgi:thiol-disulfide isomerase/thioredoxin
MFPWGSYPQFSFVLRFFCPRQRRSSKPILLVTLLILLTFFLSFRISAQNKIVWSDQETPIVEQLHGLRKLDDTVRARTTKDLAMQIRQLPIVPNKLKLAGALAGLSTEGDFGRDTLQEVTTTLALALREQPPAGKPGEPDPLYVELASLARYEHIHGESGIPQFAEAMAQLEANDADRQNADFTLTDLQGKGWNLKDLRGKVVLVNFWATWCARCRKEMPDLDALYSKFKASSCSRFRTKRPPRSHRLSTSAKSVIRFCSTPDEKSMIFLSWKEFPRAWSTTETERWLRSRSTCAPGLSSSKCSHQRACSRGVRCDI